MATYEQGCHLHVCGTRLGIPVLHELCITSNQLYKPAQLQEGTHSKHEFATQNTEAKHDHCFALVLKQVEYREAVQGMLTAPTTYYLVLRTCRHVKERVTSRLSTAHGTAHTAGSTPSSCIKLPSICMTVLAAILSTACRDSRMRASSQPAEEPRHRWPRSSLHLYRQQLLHVHELRSASSTSAKSFMEGRQLKPECGGSPHSMFLSLATCNP